MTLTNNEVDRLYKTFDRLGTELDIIKADLSDIKIELAEKRDRMRECEDHFDKKYVTKCSFGKHFIKEFGKLKDNTLKLINVFYVVLGIFNIIILSIIAITKL